MNYIVPCQKIHNGIMRLWKVYKTTIKIGLKVDIKNWCQKYNMSLKQSIRRILREESSLVEKINLMIKKFGLLKTIRAVGSHIKFKNIYGDNLTKEEKIVLLRDIVNRYSSDNEGYYIDVANYDIFVDIDYNQTDSYDYITKITSPVALFQRL